MHDPAVRVENLSKTYASGFQALKHIELEIRRQEIFALLGPNGAGKTTLISIICGIVNPTQGKVSVDGKDMTVAADTVIVCAGQEPRRELQGHHIIGGAKEASELDAKRAMLEGAELAAAL